MPRPAREKRFAKHLWKRGARRCCYCGCNLVHVYTCKKHPNWTLENRTPIGIPMKQFCPLCKEELFEKMIGLADCRIDMREVDKRS